MTSGNRVIFEGVSDRDEAIASRCAARIAMIEVDIRALKARVDATSNDIDGIENVLVEMEMAQSELEFWRSKHALLGGRRRQAGRDGYLLVPRRPSERAINLANGYTDLVDVSASPRNMSSTRSEIELAIRIANEEDGVHILHNHVPLGTENETDLDARLEDRKETLHRLSEVEADLVKISARYMGLKEALDRVVAGEETLADLVDGEKALDATFGSASSASPESVIAWRELFAASLRSHW